MFNKQKVDANTFTTAEDKATESLRHENKNLKEKLSNAFELETSDIEKLNELLLIAKAVKAFDDETLVLDASTSKKTGGNIVVDIINAKTKAKFGTARFQGSEAFSKRNVSSYYFNVSAVVLTVGSATITVPKQWVDDYTWSWVVNNMIDEYSAADVKAALKDIEKAIKLA